jgi:ribose/xylose/arabinose/galactoside ABC-type transport system permease subunit
MHSWVQRPSSLAGRFSIRDLPRGRACRAMLVLASFIGFVGAGQMLVVLVGGIDLSMPWVLNGAAIVLTTTSLGRTSRMPLAIVLALTVGAVVGFANGVGVAWLKVPAVVMTLGMNGVLEGLSLGLTDSVAYRRNSSSGLGSRCSSPSC